MQLILFLFIKCILFTNFDYSKNLYYSFLLKCHLINTNYSSILRIPQTAIFCCYCVKLDKHTQANAVANLESALFQQNIEIIRIAFMFE